MLKIMLISAWIWGHIVGKFMIWPRRLKGLLWIPILYASNWYRITEMKGKCLYIYLPHIYLYENILCLFLFIFLPLDDILILMPFTIHTVNNIWWPAFIEIKYTFYTCFILAILNIFITFLSIIWTIYKHGYPIFIIFNIAILLSYSWHVWISGYAYFIVKKPTTYIEYQERQSRQTMEV